MIRFAIFTVIALVVVPVVEMLFHLPLPLSFNVPFAIAVAGVALLVSEIGMKPYSPQPQEPHREVRKPYGGSAWAEAKRLGRSDSESESQSQADQPSRPQ